MVSHLTSTVQDHSVVVVSCFLSHMKNVWLQSQFSQQIDVSGECLSRLMPISITSVVCRSLHVLPTLLCHKQYKTIKN